MGLWSRLRADALSIASAKPEDRVTPTIAVHMLAYDGYCALALSRMREEAIRWHVPGANYFLRMAQLTFYSIEISKEATLDVGVNFMHTTGVVIGGDSQIGEGTIFLGNATIGNLHNRGYPKVGKRVVIGAGARILGPVTIGDGALIGANAVVVTDVPAGATAVGVPAVIKVKDGQAKQGGQGGQGAHGAGRPDAVAGRPEDRT